LPKARLGIGAQSEVWKINKIKNIKIKNKNKKIKIK